MDGTSKSTDLEWQWPILRMYLGIFDGQSILKNVEREKKRFRLQIERNSNCCVVGFLQH